MGPESINRYRLAVAALDDVTTNIIAAKRANPQEHRVWSEFRLDRLRHFLHFLGDPHHEVPVVHVAGTSGKGSTSTAIAGILSAAGYCVGLHTSPYLQSATEKLQINGRLVDPDTFADLVDEVFAKFSEFADSQTIPLTYFEAWMALLSLYFARSRVDIAVVEAGIGGRFDMTNVLSPMVSVITSIGLDHTDVLGKTIPDIAWQKAGIVKPGAPVVTAVGDSLALAVIDEEASRAGVKVTQVIPGETLEILDTTLDGTRWRDLATPTSLRDKPVLRTPLPGRFQAVNAATAVAVVRELGALGFPVPQHAIATGLNAARIPGRSETVQLNPRVLLDGAHNPEKVGAVASDLRTLFVQPSNARLIVVLGVLESKDHAFICQMLAPIAEEIIVTTPRAFVKPGTPVDMLAGTLAQVKFAGRVSLQDDPDLALDRALASAGEAQNSVVLIIGSLYLVGNLRHRWYSDDAVVLQRTMWPA